MKYIHFLFILTLPFIFSTCKKDLKEWKTVKKFPSGQVKEQTRSDENGRMLGRLFYENGSLYQELSWINDSIIDGECFTYYDNGQISKEYHFKNGKNIGDCLEYYKNGKISSKEHFIDGKLQGYSYYFFETGNPSLTNYFKNDSVHYIKKYIINNYGKITDSIEQYIPLITIDSDSIDINNKVSITIEIPLDSIQLETLMLSYIILKKKPGENVSINKNDFEIYSMKNGGCIIKSTLYRPKNNVILGYFHRTVNGKKIKYQLFDRIIS